MSCKDGLLIPLLRRTESFLFGFAIRHRKNLFLKDGITIAQLGEEDNSVAIQDIKSAIDLIKKHSEAEFVRLQKYVEYICIAKPRGAVIGYVPGKKICLIDWNKVRTMLGADVGLDKRIAALIVRSVMSGYLYARGINPGGKNKERWILLCEKKIDRFQKTLG